MTVIHHHQRLRAFVLVSLYSVILFTLSPRGAEAAFLTIGDPGDGTNCFPFTCSNDPAFPSTRYQQVYNSSLFSGQAFINQVAFFASEPVSIDAANYDIRLSTTSKAVNSLDTADLDNNVGSDETGFFSGVLGGLSDAVFAINGTPFAYDPSLGNLLVDVRKDDLPAPGSGFLDARNGSFGDDSSRAHNFGTAFEQWGLVTRFQLGSQGGPGPGPGPGPDPNDPIPEPASVILVGLGLACAVARRGRGRPH